MGKQSLSTVRITWNMNTLCVQSTGFRTVIIWLSCRE